MALPALLAKPLISTGVTMGLSALNKILGGKKTGPGMIDPRKFKDELTMSQSDLIRGRQRIGRQINRQGATAANRLRSGTAAGRLPSGALADQLGNLQYRQGEAIGQSELDLMDKKRQMDKDYYAQLQGYERAKEEANRAAQPLDLTDEIGTMGKVALMQAMGMFGEDEEEGGGGGGEPDPLVGVNQNLGTYLSTLFRI